MAMIPTARSVWERRRWFRDLVAAAYRKRDGALRVLDVAGGGTRYLRDFLETVEPGPRFELTVVDQDAAAIAFCRAQSLAPWASRVRFVCAPIRSLAERLVDSDFDLVISAGLFDYLEAGPARALLAHLASLLAAQGTLAISNFHPGDGSRLVKEWLVEWPLVFRDEAACAELFPAQLRVRTSLSSNQALVFASGSAAPQRAPFVSTLADVGFVVGMTADGGIVEGRAATRGD
jgi:extracellular factor (EF) 3-hydroxypalmitic acid methyl ester biosynthesis protein